MLSPAWPDHLNVALKEWAAVCDAVGSGRQLLLLRKGGIQEDAGAGKFVVEHEQFLLFPTYAHQKLDLLKPDVRALAEPRSAEPATLTLATACAVTDVVKLRARSQMDAIDADHVWMPPLVDLRFDYKPHNPLFLVLVRAYRLTAPATIANTPEYAGCKSWVPL
ncbi:MAG TPA: DUF1802 family protein, partial [Tepidisphaeraceae bacterium]|nr:DUF1802 family protein [Tepidisphaeraceae bacterium]